MRKYLVIVSIFRDGSASTNLIGPVRADSKLRVSQGTPRQTWPRQTWRCIVSAEEPLAAMAQALEAVMGY